MLDKNYHVKIIDFGDAKTIDEVQEEIKKAEEAAESAEGFEDMTHLNESRKGTFVGTINYLAPEMIEDSQAYLSTDLWALGCILFKMLTGVVPF